MGGTWELSKKTDKKSSSTKSKKNKTPEPWEQSIYDTEYETNTSRTQQRSKKRGNTVFLTLLLIMLVLIIAIPAIVWVMIINGDDKPAQTAPSSTVSSSTISSSTSESSSESSESSSSSEESQEPEPEVDTPESAPVVDTPQQNEAEYATVNNGEGPYTFANRHGISLQTLYELNGINENSTLQPGESLRIR